MTVEALIEPATLLSSACRHDRQPALANDPAQHQPGDIQREGRWRVEAALLHGLHLVAERRGQAATRWPEQILANDHQAQSGYAEVLLRAGVDEPEALDGNRSREEVRRHVRYQRHRQFGEVRHLQAVAGFVAGDMAIAGVRVASPSCDGRQSREATGCATGDDVHRRVSARLADRLVRPVAAFQVIGRLPRFQQVERQQTELRRGATLHEQHPVVVRNRQQRT